jgi:hypothetical protein
VIWFTYFNNIEVKTIQGESETIITKGEEWKESSVLLANYW